MPLGGGQLPILVATFIADVVSKLPVLKGTQFRARFKKYTKAMYAYAHEWVTTGRG